MKLKNALNLSKNSNRGVSPVIGVILMVVITVILAGVVAVSFMGFGDQVDEGAPQASFEADYDSQTLTLTHQNGDEIDASNLKLFVDGSEVKTFSGDISAGSQLTYDKGSSWNGESVRLVYDDGDSTATLYTNDAAPQYLSATTYDTSTQFTDVLYSAPSSNYDTTGDVITLTTTSTESASYAANGGNGLSPNPASEVDVTISSVDDSVAIAAYDSDMNQIDSISGISSTGTYTLSASGIDMIRFESTSGSGTTEISSFTIKG